MTDKRIVIIAECSDDATLTLDELGVACGVPAQVIIDIIEHDIVRPSQNGDALTFQVDELNRLKAAVRLHKQLDINLAGVALALDLLDEIEDLRMRASILERHLLK